MWRHAWSSSLNELAVFPASVSRAASVSPPSSRAESDNQGTSVGVPLSSDLPCVRIPTSHSLIRSSTCQRPTWTRRLALYPVRGEARAVCENDRGSMRWADVGVGPFHPWIGWVLSSRTVAARGEMRCRKQRSIRLAGRTREGRGRSYEERQKERVVEQQQKALGSAVPFL